MRPHQLLLLTVLGLGTLALAYNAVLVFQGGQPPISRWLPGLDSDRFADPASRSGPVGDGQGCCCAADGAPRRC
jgi:hypothetical protein